MTIQEMKKELQRVEADLETLFEDVKKTGVKNDYWHDLINQRNRIENKLFAMEEEVE